MTKRRLHRKIRELIGVREGSLSPDWLLWILFPLRMWYSKFANIKYDGDRDVYIIEGRSLAGDLIRSLPKEKS